MSQSPLHYNENDPEGQWRLLRDGITAADADFVATQTRPPDDLLLGTPPPGPANFDGIRFFLVCYAAADPTTIIAGGTWSAQPIEVGALPPLVPPVSTALMSAVLGGEVITEIDGLGVVTLGGWREGVVSIRVAALAFPVGADTARIYVREF